MLFDCISLSMAFILSHMENIKKYLYGIFSWIFIHRVFTNLFRATKFYLRTKHFQMPCKLITIFCSQLRMFHQYTIKSLGK